MKILLLAAALTGGCARLDRATLVTQTASIACDWAQTRHAASGGWIDPKDGSIMEEANPLLGPYPSVAQVDTYFVASAIVTTFVWLVIPRKYRSIWGGGITIMQSKTIVGNAETTGTICGI